MRTGVRLGIDYGAARIGVARSDRDGLMAVPVATLKADEKPLDQIKDLLSEFAVFEIIVGMPLNMSGTRGPSAHAAQAFARELASVAAPVAVRTIDERLSTVESSRSLAAAGRNTRNSKSVIDQAAAVTILQSAWDSERRTQRPAGTPVES